jgi:hypothetical protein
LVSDKDIERLNALAYTWSHDLRYIMPYFNVKTGKPREYERVLKWPSITHKNYGKGSKSNITGKFLSLVDDSIKKIFGTSMTLCNDIFTSEKSTLTCTLGILFDYAAGKIDDSQFFTIHKLLNSEDKMSLPKEVQGLTKDSDSENVVQSFGIAYKANYLTQKVEEQERPVLD